MRQNLLLSLTACFCIAACADHRGSMNAADNGPQSPVNEPDSGAWNPPGSNTPANAGTSGTTTPPDDPHTNGSGSTGSAGSTGGNTGSNAGNGGGSEGPGSPASGTEGGGGTGGGEPVPEPGTLLLVGAGLAGAALLRRRRQQAR